MIVGSPHFLHATKIGIATQAPPACRRPCFAGTVSPAGERDKFFSVPRSTKSTLANRSKSSKLKKHLAFIPRPK